MTSDPLRGPSDSGVLANRIMLEVRKTLPKLRTFGLDEVAELAEEVLQRGSQPPRVVVIGETKRGKSSLVNAIVGLEGLSPVARSESTDAFIEVWPLSDDEPEPFALVPSETGAGVRCGIEEYHERSEAGAVVAPLGVRLYGPGVPGVVLVDTPGIGGATTNRAILSRSLARDGGALLYVVDAGSPLAATELGHLEACAAETEHVVVVVTMTDKYPATATEMLTHVRNQLLSSARLQRIPVVGVSSRLFHAASRLPAGEQRDALLAGTGIPAVRAWVEAIATQATAVHRAKALRLCRTGATQHLGQLTRQRAALADPAQNEALGAELDRLRAEAEQLENEKDRWTLDLERSLSRIRRDLITLAETRLNTLDQDGRKRIEKLPLTTGRQKYVELISVDMAAAYQLIQQELSAELSRRLDAVVRDLFGTEMPGGLAELSAPGAVVQFELTPSRGDLGQMMDPGVVMAAMSGGLIGSRILGGVGAVVGAGAYLALQMAFKGQVLDRSKALTAFREEVSRQRAHLSREIQSTMDDLRPEVVAGYRKRLRLRERALASAVQEAQRAKNASISERRAVLAKVESNSAELRDLARSIDDVLALAQR